MTDPVIELDVPTHRYTVRIGDLVRHPPSVTTVLDAVYPWSVDPVVLKAAGDLGTDVHLACELFDRGTLDWTTVDPIVKPYLDAWILFRQTHDFEPTAIEERVYSKRFDYVGTADRWGIMKMGRHGRSLSVQVDIKSGTTRPTHGMQTAAYEQARIEMTGKPASSRRLCCYLKPTGRFYLVAHEDTDDFSRFASTLAVYRFKQRNDL
jgi:hypothetical protein